MTSLYPLRRAAGMGEVDLLSDPTVTATNGAQFSVEPGKEPFNAVLTANQTQRDLSQYFGKDHIFIWTGLVSKQTGAYQIQLVLPSGRLYSSAPVYHETIMGSAQFPAQVWPYVKVPAGGKIGVQTLIDVSGAGNTVQIVFHGLRLYTVRGPQQ